MSVVSLRIDATDLFAKAKRLSAMANGVPRAIREGLNEGGDKVRTDVTRALFAQMGTKTQKPIRENMRTVRATEGGLIYSIIGTGKGLKIREFKTQLRRGAGGGVTGYPWAVQHNFKRSFALGNRNDPAAFRARLPGPKVTVMAKGGMYGVRPIKVSRLRTLYGPSVAKEIVTGKVPGVFLLSVQAQVPPIILKRLARTLGTTA